MTAKKIRTFCNNCVADHVSTETAERTPKTTVGPKNAFDFLMDGQI